MQFINLQRLFYEFYLFLSGQGQPADFTVYVKEFLEAITPIATIVSLLFLTGIIYCMIRLHQIKNEERAWEEKQRAYRTEEGLPSTEGLVKAQNARWQHIEKLISSENMNDWRQAILNADIMLDELLSTMGYSGENLGEKLKKVNEKEFTTLDQAWKAHKTRNTIAHEGEGFVLTPRRARETINLYKEVFNEFNYI